MGFLAAAAPALISGGASLLGGLFGGKAAAPGGVSGSQANQLAGNLTSNVGALGQTGQQQTGFGMGQQQQGAGNLQGGAGYFQTLLNGNRANTTQLLAPQIQQTQQQFQRALQTGSQLDPRGGGRAATLFNLPSQASSSLLGAYDTIRPQAAQQLAQIGQAQGQLGAQATGLGNQAFGLANQGAGGGLQNQLAVNQATQQAGAGIAGGISNILKPINWGNIFGGNKNGTSSTTLQFPGVG